MNIDSRICEYVIADFIQTHTPILTVHDSFIVPFGEEDRLKQVMQEAFERETNKVNIKVKFNENLTKRQLYVHGAQDRNWLPSRIDTLRKGDPADGYKRRPERHREHFGGDEAKT